MGLGQTGRWEMLAFAGVVAAGPDSLAQGIGVHKLTGSALEAEATGMEEPESARRPVWCSPDLGAGDDPPNPKPEPVDGFEQAAIDFGLNHRHIKVRDSGQPHPDAGVTVAYRVRFPDGTLLLAQCTAGVPAPSPGPRPFRGSAGEVGAMRVGGIRQFEIPLELDYGDERREVASPNADLIVEPGPVGSMCIPKGTRGAECARECPDHAVGRGAGLRPNC